MTARGLSIHTGDPQGEEFPLFRSVWIEKPTLAANALIIHALARFGERHRRFSLHAAPRRGDDHRHRADDFRARGGRSYRPWRDDRHLSVRRSRSIPKYTTSAPMFTRSTGCKCLPAKANGYGARSPIARLCRFRLSSIKIRKGFGLLQRSRSYYTFQDDDQHWETRPSLWIEPIGDWGEGQVQLLEIPTESENNDNIIAYWRPEGGPCRRGEPVFRLSPILVLDAAGAARRSRSSPACAWAKIGKRWRFVVEFSSEVFCRSRASQRRYQGQYHRQSRPDRLEPRPLHPPSARRFGSPSISTRARRLFSELRVVLEAAGQPASETWLYRWTA